MTAMERLSRGGGGWGGGRRGPRESVGGKRPGDGHGGLELRDCPGGPVSPVTPKVKRSRRYRPCHAARAVAGRPGRGRANGQLKLVHEEVPGLPPGVPRERKILPCEPVGSGFGQSRDPLDGAADTSQPLV